MKPFVFSAPMDAVMFSCIIILSRSGQKYAYADSVVKFLDKTALFRQNLHFSCDMLIPEGVM